MAQDGLGEYFLFLFWLFKYTFASSGGGGNGDDGIYNMIIMVQWDFMCFYRGVGAWECKL